MHLHLFVFKSGIPKQCFWYFNKEFLWEGIFYDEVINLERVSSAEIENVANC